MNGFPGRTETKIIMFLGLIIDSEQKKTAVSAVFFISSVLCGGGMRNRMIQLCSCILLEFRDKASVITHFTEAAVNLLDFLVKH